MPPLSTVNILPILDLKPTDLSCIYTTLLFVRDQAKKFNIVPSVTFDQPLYIKAVDICIAENLDVVCRLGGFHTLMNFLGAIGHVMKGSGLEELMGLLYGTNTVEHVLSGKAYARSIRGHFIIHDALIQLLLLTVLKNRFKADGNQSLCCADDVTAAVSHIYEQCWNNGLDVHDCSILENEHLLDIGQKLDELKHLLASQSRTCNLWLHYIDYVDVVKLFILAEWTSDWFLHLTACERMLYLLAATGHYNYAKSCRLYVQQMHDLCQSHPALHEQFVNGNHTIRRSDRLWAGLSCDLVIEQTLMKSVKGRGGLTRGRGMHSSVRYAWTNTMSECASIHLAMSTLTGLNDRDHEHVEVTNARMNRDEADLRKVKNCLFDNSPFRFVDAENLVSLSSGVVAHPGDGVTCDIAEEVGFKIQQSWDDSQLLNICGKRRDQIKTLADLTTSSTIGGKIANVDVNSLFHRLLILGERSIDVRSFFQFELTHYPTSLFSSGFMRKPDKPSLYKQAAEGLMSETVPMPCRYVVDGGCLLHRVRWTRGQKCDEVLDQYVQYVLSKFGCNAVVIFDGHGSTPSTKDHEHRRRSSKVSKVAPSVSLEPVKAIMFDQEQFLGNHHNKAAFIDMLMYKLGCVGVEAHQSNGDADTDIVAACLRLAEYSDCPVTVYADDTDILCMLLFHWRDHMSDIMFLSEGRKSNALKKCINIGSLQQKLGHKICHAILVLHALGGCDTTSAIFGIGKATILKKLGNQQHMRNIDIIQNEHSTHEDVRKAGLHLMKAVYGGLSAESLTALRYSTYVKLISCTLGKLRPEKLPPTEQAAYFHVCRVHLQSVEWKTLSSDTHCPTEWGWKLEGNLLTPITSDQPIAPSEILHVVRCGCKTSCSTDLCTCRKNGLHCMPACKCYGRECDNGEPLDLSCCDIDDAEIVYDDDIDWVEEEIVE